MTAPTKDRMSGQFGEVIACAIANGSVSVKWMEK